jgi:RND family efflux transporter MFP subunit
MQQMKKVFRISIWIVVLLVAIGIIAFKLFSNKQKAAGEINKELVAMPFTVAAAYVKEETFSADVSFRGTVEVKNIITIFSEADGKLISSAIEKGRLVNRGQVIATVDKVLRVAANQINNIGFEKAQADYNIAKANANRYTALLKENNATAVETENAALQLKAAELQLKTIQQQINISQKQLGQTVIHSPVAGIIIDKKAHAGDYVQAGTPLGTIAELHTVIVKIFIPETFITKLKSGTPVSMIADIYPGISFNGIIKNIIPVANEAKAFPLEIEIANNQMQKLMAGMSMSAIFKPASSVTALTIPRTAITGDILKPTVYIIDGSKKPVLTSVGIGRDFGNSIEIISGLKKGDIVIVSGQSNIEQGKILKDYKIAVQ